MTLLPHPRFSKTLQRSQLSSPPVLGCSLRIFTHSKQGIRIDNELGHTCGRTNNAHGREEGRVGDNWGGRCSTGQFAEDLGS
jgi:hypothetical protein